MQNLRNSQGLGDQAVEEQLFLVAYGWENEVVTYRFARRRDKAGKKKIGLNQTGPIQHTVDRLLIYSDAAVSNKVPALVLDLVDGKLQWQSNKPLT